MPQNFAEAARLAYLSWLQAEDNAEELFIRTARDYVAGRHPTYLDDRQKEYLGLTAKDADHLFAHNLCQLVIQSLVERLAVTGFAALGVGAPSGTSAPEAAQSGLTGLAAQWWEANRMDAEQDRIYEAACRDGAAYLIVDWDAATGMPKWVYNERFDGTQGVRVYRDPNTNEILFAAKRWQVYDPYDKAMNGRTRYTLYFPDRVEKYISTKDSNAGLGGLQLEAYTGEGDNGGIVPWVDLQGHPLGCAVMAFENPDGSEVAQLLGLQDMLNKADLDLIAATDTAGFRLLYASGVTRKIGADGVEEDVDIGPGRLITMPDPAARLGAIEPTDPTLMIRSSKYWIESIAGVSRTPQYLFQSMGADQPSGESLKMQEVGLIHKCERRQNVWGNVWEDVVYLSAKLHNLYRSAEPVSLDRVQAQWADPQIEEPEDVVEERRSRTRQANTAAGIPLITQLRREGWTEEEIEAMQADKEGEAAAQTVTLGAALARAQRQFDAGPTNRGAGPQDRGAP